MTRNAVHVYCLDGTNLVRCCYGYGGESFRDQEESDARRLVAALSQLCLELGERLEVEVFFDGALRSLGGGAANLSVRFTHETQADDLILDRVRSRRFSGGGSVTVVTGDGELGRLVAEEGARWQRVNPGTPLESVLNSIEKRFS